VRGVARTGGPRLSLTKRADRRAVLAGGTLRYAIVLRNRGTEAARDVRVCDRLPRQATVVAGKGGRLRDGSLCWTVTVKAGGSRTLTLTVRVDRDAGAVKRMRNVATATRRGGGTLRAHADVRVDPGAIATKPDGVTG
jgi:uncharacterized repeat protein (TIGR01451 family)